MTTMTPLLRKLSNRIPITIKSHSNHYAFALRLDSDCVMCSERHWEGRFLTCPQTKKPYPHQNDSFQKVEIWHTVTSFDKIAIIPDRLISQEKVLRIERKVEILHDNQKEISYLCIVNRNRYGKLLNVEIADLVRDNVE